MLKPKLITILSIVFFALSFNLSRAECNLNLKNLSINNQTNTDKTDIVRLQSILYINELYDGPITGYYGNLTSKAINNLKKQYNLKQDGIVDDLVINILCDNYTLCPFRSDLKKDSEYPAREIKTIQSFLRLIPNIYPERLVTGYYGSKTENAVKRLQKQLDISQTGRMDITTRNAFCSFFNSFDDISNTNTNTTSIFQTLCLAFPKQVKTGDNVLFISQILGGTSPYKYIWNNKDTNNDKTFKTMFPKSGTYTVGLKVIDSKGNISSTNCSVSVTGESIGDLDWNGLSLDEGSSPIEKNKTEDISKYDKYLHDKKAWTSGWICYSKIGLILNQGYTCTGIQKTKSIYDDLIYSIGGQSSGINNLPKNSMVYSSKEECNSFCDSKLGDKNTIALNESFTNDYGWVCNYVSTGKCSYLENISSLNLNNKKVYASSIQCNEECSSISATTIPTQEKYLTSKKTTQVDIDKLIQNPINLDFEILPKEIVVNDPVKIDVINLPPWARNMLDNPDNQLTLRGYWSGDIVNQYLDTIKSEYTSYDLIGKNNKILNTEESVPSCGDRYIYVPKVIPMVYCGDNKCHLEESDPKNTLYCRKDCLNKKDVISNSNIDIRTNTNVFNVLFNNLVRKLKTETRTLVPRFYNSGVFSLINDIWFQALKGNYTLYNNVINERKPEINNSVDMKRNFYDYNPNLKNGVLGRRYLYWTFDKPGNYTINYTLYFYNSITNKEYLIGKTNNYNISVVKKPTAGKYMRVFLTYEKPEAGKIDCPKNFYWLDPSNETLIYITPEIAKFKNIVTKFTSWPYRDLDGNFISFDWNHLYVKSQNEGGDMWYYNQHDDNYYPVTQPGTANLSVPLIADRKYEKLMTKPITNQNKIDYNVLNRTVARTEGIDLGSRYLQPFSCKEDGNVYYGPTSNICLGMDSATSIVFGYQNNEDIKYSEGWRSQDLNSNIYSGHGITSLLLGKKQRTLCIEEPLIEEKHPISKRNNEYYSDMVISNFKLGEIKDNKRSVTIDIENIGGQTVGLDEIVKKGTAINDIVTCNRLSDGTGENIGTFHYSFVGNGLNPQSKMTLKANFDCRPKDTRNANNHILPAIDQAIEIACFVDPKNLEEETNENNNILTNIYFNCK